MTVYLASASPRRRELLAQLGVECVVRPVDIDERCAPGEVAAEHVRRLARDKARLAREQGAAPETAVILAADTAVAIGTAILGKPADEADGLRMLAELSGRRHDVYTAVAVVDGQREALALSRSSVLFRELAAAEIRAYWHTGEPADKAGAYAIQGRGAMFVADLTGSYSGVMGLPLFETAQMLESFGIELLDMNHGGAWAKKY